MIKILTSGFNKEFSSVVKKYIKSDMTLAFIASEFEKIYDTTDFYCNEFMKMFSDCGINFKSVKVVDGRMDKKTAQETVKNADVLWLAGGDTSVQFRYLESYGLSKCIREHNGVVIGMSAGSINMTKTVVCTLTCKHDKLEIYKALGLVDFSVEPHLDKDNISEELLFLSEKYPLYGICDNGAIICTDEGISYLGDVYLLDKRAVRKIN